MAKKTVKKILKALLVGGTGLLAAKALGGKKGLKGADVEGGRGFNLRGKIRTKLPDHLTHDLGSAYGQRDSSRYTYPGTGLGAAKGGRIGAKHGGKVKSMGVAKRGGGVAKR